ncbi:LPXTG cell wall anchor domain-containing protein, partial [Streptococcus hyointestinalis]|uniref:mucin-binding protein n=1 Tax=Streptococcus hyointestinalis TaxID=1337 RepID=UPI0035178B1D
TQTVEFTRTAKVNLVTGEVTYGEWKTEEGTSPAVDSPTIPGYTPDQATVVTWTPSADDVDSNVIVVYTPDKQEATVTYVDITTGDEVVLGEVDSLTGVTDAKIDYSTADRIKAYEEAGYELVEDGFPVGEVYDKDSNVTQEYKVTLRQKVVDVDPERPVNPKDNSPIELAKTVTRTIEYKYLTPTGEEASGTITQTVEFTRTAKVNLVTGEVTYGEWKSENNTFPLVVSPEIDGYTVDQAEVPAMDVTVDSEDSNVVVIYTPVEKPEPEKAKPFVAEKPQMKESYVGETLPETGDSDNLAMAFLGLRLLGAVSLVGFAKRKKD